MVKVNDAYCNNKDKSEVNFTVKFMQKWFVFMKQQYFNATWNSFSSKTNEQLILNQKNQLLFKIYCLNLHYFLAINIIMNYEWNKMK